MSSRHHLDESAQGRVKIHRRRGERRVERVFVFEGITSTLHYTVQPSTGSGRTGASLFSLGHAQGEWDARLFRTK